MNIKDEEVERLAAEIAALTGESKTRAVRVALEERRARLAFRVVHTNRAASLRRFLEQEVWPTVPKGVLGKAISREEEDDILGYGDRGV
jgi:antitoxin VapB